MLHRRDDGLASAAANEVRPGESQVMSLHLASRETCSSCALGSRAMLPMKAEAPYSMCWFKRKGFAQGMPAMLAIRVLKDAGCT